MPSNLDKGLILNEIKSHYAIKTDTEFAIFLGIAQSTIASWHKRNSFDVDLIIAKCPEIDANWLLTGKGEMLKSSTARAPEAVRVHPNFMEVPVVSQYAYAGYLSGYSDPSFMEALPTHPFVIPDGVTAKGRYLSFEVRGDSMENGSDSSILENDLILGRHIQPSLYQDSKLHISKWFFIIVHRTEGILVKQITHHDVERGTITIHSLNSEYADQVLRLQDVAEIFNVVQVVRKPKPASY